MTAGFLNTPNYLTLTTIQSIIVLVIIPFLKTKKQIKTALRHCLLRFLSVRIVLFFLPLLPLVDQYLIPRTTNEFVDPLVVGPLLFF